MSQSSFDYHIRGKRDNHKYINIYVLIISEIFHSLKKILLHSTLFTIQFLKYTSFTKEYAILASHPLSLRYMPFLHIHIFTKVYAILAHPFSAI